MKGRYRMIAFDFDGTLVDTAPDIADTANLVLERNGFTVRDLDEVKEAIGKGVRDLMQRLIKPKTVGDAELERLVREFKEHYAANLVRRSRPYPGVIEVLRGPLASMKKVIVTNKPHAFTVEILRVLGMEDCFECVIGTGLDFPAKPDPTGLRHAMELCSASAPETIIVGDSSVDMTTAYNASVDFAWVDYGYEDLRRLTPPLTFKHAAEWRILADGPADR